MRVVGGKLKMRRVRQRGKSVENVEISRSGPITVVLLDITWSKYEFWTQAKEKLISLLDSAPGVVYVANISPFARKPALFKNQLHFKLRVLPLLNQRIANEGNPKILSERVGHPR